MVSRNERRAEIKSNTFEEVPTIFEIQQAYNNLYFHSVSTYKHQQHAIVINIILSLGLTYLLYEQQCDSHMFSLCKLLLLAL